MNEVIKKILLKKYYFKKNITTHFNYIINHERSYYYKATPTKHQHQPNLIKKILHFILKKNPHLKYLVQINIMLQNF